MRELSEEKTTNRPVEKKKTCVFGEAKEREIISSKGSQHNGGGGGSTRSQKNPLSSRVQTKSGTSRGKKRKRWATTRDPGGWLDPEGKRDGVLVERRHHACGSKKFTQSPDRAIERTPAGGIHTDEVGKAKTMDIYLSN